MKISAQMAVWLCAVFALICFGVAFTGFSSAPSITDAVERDLSLGYAWFWTFLAGVAVVFGVLSWLAKEGKLGKIE
jgi:NADH:ubiquinone oxidoreductase subunit 6 (subunit J)